MAELKTLYTRIQSGIAGKAPQISIEDSETGQQIGYLDNDVLASPFGSKLLQAITDIRKNMPDSQETKDLQLKELVVSYMNENKNTNYATALAAVARANPRLWI